MSAPGFVTFTKEDPRGFKIVDLDEWRAFKLSEAIYNVEPCEPGDIPEDDE
jgi:hypothetical protein